MKGLSLLKQSFTETLAKFTAAGLFISLVAIGALASAGPVGPPEGVMPMFNGDMLADGQPRPVFMIALPNQVGQQLESITMNITPGQGNPFFQNPGISSELLNKLGGSDSSGIALWKSGSQNFDTYYSERVFLDGPFQYSNNTVTFDVKGSGTPIMQGMNFFITVTPKDKDVKHEKGFVFTIPAGGVVSSGDDLVSQDTSVNLTIDGPPAVRTLTSIDQNANGTHLEQGG